MRRINYQLPAGPFIVRSNARKTRLAPLAALLLMLAFLHPPGAAAQAWPWTSYPTFFPSETNIALHTLPDEIATGQSMMVQFMAINYTTQDWTAATAHLAVTQDTAGLFPSQRIDLPDGVIVSFIRQGRFTTTIDQAQAITGRTHQAVAKTQNSMRQSNEAILALNASSSKISMIDHRSHKRHAVAACS